MIRKIYSIIILFIVCFTCDTAIGQILTQEICLVTVDSSIHKNLVVWEKSVFMPYYHVYRESTPGVYDKIATIPYDTVSCFVDSTSDPDVQPNSYKMTAGDSSGVEGPMGAAHETIHLSLTQSPGSVELTWSASLGIPFLQYRIWRGSRCDSMEVIDSVSGGITSYTDFSLPVSDCFFYLIDATPPFDCIAFKVKPHYRSYSNIMTIDNGGIGCSCDTIITTGISKLHANRFQVTASPNPFSESITFKLGNLTNGLPVTFKLFDLLGHEVMIIPRIRRREFTVNREGLSDGIYFYSITSRDGLIGGGKVVVN